MKFPEATISEAVAKFFLSQGGAVFREVASLGQSADLVWFRNGELTFIEVKVNAVKRAMEQCRAHELVADYVCIAIGGYSVSDLNLDRLTALGYGLISCVDGNCRWLLKPQRQTQNWLPARQVVVTRMKETS